MLTFAISRKPLGTDGEPPCIYCCVTLRKIFIVPSVTMNGGILPLVTSTPFSSPNSQPAKTPTRTASTYTAGPEIPMEYRNPLGPESISIMTMAPTATREEPTERSMPPDTMTKVMPSAIMPTLALLRRILIQLRSHVENHAPKESNSKPRASVCRTTMTKRAMAVLNSGYVVHMRRNQGKNPSRLIAAVSFIRFLPLFLLKFLRWQGA